LKPVFLYSSFISSLNSSVIFGPAEIPPCACAERARA
jgi:hypothetical protein